MDFDLWAITVTQASWTVVLIREADWSILRHERELCHEVNMNNKFEPLKFKMMIPWKWSRIYKTDDLK